MCPDTVYDDKNVPESTCIESSVIADRKQKPDEHRSLAGRCGEIPKGVTSRPRQHRKPLKHISLRLATARSLCFSPFHCPAFAATAAAHRFFQRISIGAGTLRCAEIRNAAFCRMVGAAP